MINVRELIKKPVLSFSNLESVNDIKQISDGNLRFFLNEKVLDTFLVKKNSPHLFIFFSSSKNPEESEFAYLNGGDLVNVTPGSCLFIADPIFNFQPENLTLEWNKNSGGNTWMQSVIDLVRKIAKLLTVEESNIIFCGSYGGGFSALKAIGLMNDGVAIAINPKTDIFEDNKKNIIEFLKHKFGKIENKVIEDIKNEKLCVFSSLARSKKAKFILVQNVSDISLYEQHYLPLCKYLGINKDQGNELKKYNTWLYDDKSISEVVCENLIKSAIKLTENFFWPMLRKDINHFGLPRRKNDSEVDFSLVEDVFIKGGAVYGVSTRVIDIYGKKYSLDALDRSCLSKVEIDYLNRFDILDGNITSYKETRKSWLIHGFVVRYIKFWYHYISNLTNDTYEYLIKRIKVIAYVVSKIQHGHITVSEDDFRDLSKIFHLHLEEFNNLNRKRTDSVYLCKNDLDLIKKVLSSDSYELLVGSLKYVLNYNPLYKQDNEDVLLQKSFENSRLYRYGFLLKPIGYGDDFIEKIGIFSRYWREISIANYNLYFHFEVCVKEFKYASKAAYVIGDIFVAHGVESIESNIEKFLSEDNWDYIDNLSGRFAIVVVQDSKLKIFTDPFGARTVYYSNVGLGVVVGSHSNLIAEICGRKICENTKKLMATFEYNNKTTKYLPGDLTIFEDIFYLIPNNYIDLSSSATYRFWPRSNIVASSFDELKECSREYFYKFNNYLKEQRQIIYYGLTGGVDTRILIAASKAYSMKFNTLTWDYKSVTPLEKDLINGISEYLGFDNIWVDLRGKNNSKYSYLSNISYLNSGLVRGKRNFISKTFAYIPENAMFVRGLGGEILRGAYNKRVSPYGTMDSIDYLVKIYNGAKNKATTSAYDTLVYKSFVDYVDRGNYRDIFDCDVGDLFYWEHRMAIWASNLLNEYDVILKNFVGINSRKLFSISYGLPDDIRFKRELILALIGEFDNFLSTYPVD